MKRTISFFAAGIFLFLLSCNSGEEKATIPSWNEKLAIVQHPVADFDVWKPLYLAHDSARKANGLTHYAYGTGIDDPHQVIVYLKMDDEIKAKAFVALPELKAVMDSAGVTGPPVIDYIQAVRNDTSATDIKDRILVKHKVKDFDAWLKVFDDEGMGKRNSHGLVDRGLGRGTEDPNMVYIVFAVSDWDKANARMNSEELKKIMTDAGVEGAPVFLKYRLVD
ncbi:MAG: hypothetical protein HC867_01140 [Bacteroidia bacterium]|nr:hypothetical protein [Bacteroidia bacterium]